MYAQTPILSDNIVGNYGAAFGGVGSTALNRQDFLFLLTVTCAIADSTAVSNTSPA